MNKNSIYEYICKRFDEKGVPINYDQAKSVFSYAVFIKRLKLDLKRNIIRALLQTVISDKTQIDNIMKTAENNLISKFISTSEKADAPRLYYKTYIGIIESILFEDKTDSIFTGTYRSKTGSDYSFPKNAKMPEIKFYEDEEQTQKQQEEANDFFESINIKDLIGLKDINKLKSILHSNNFDFDDALSEAVQNNISYLQIDKIKRQFISELLEKVYIVVRSSNPNDKISDLTGPIRDLFTDHSFAYKEIKKIIKRLFIPNKAFDPLIKYLEQQFPVPVNITKTSVLYKTIKLYIYNQQNLDFMATELSMLETLKQLFDNNQPIIVQELTRCEKEIRDKIKPKKNSSSNDSGDNDSGNNDSGDKGSNDTYNSDEHVDIDISDFDKTQLVDTMSYYTPNVRVWGDLFAAFLTVVGEFEKDISFERMFVPILSTLKEKSEAEVKSYFNKIDLAAHIFSRNIDLSQIHTKVDFNKIKRLAELFAHNASSNKVTYNINSFNTDSDLIHVISKFLRTENVKTSVTNYIYDLYRAYVDKQKALKNSDNAIKQQLDNTNWMDEGLDDCVGRIEPLSITAFHNKPRILIKQQDDEYIVEENMTVNKPAEGNFIIGVKSKLNDLFINDTNMETNDVIRIVREKCPMIKKIYVLMNTRNLNAYERRIAKKKMIKTCSRLYKVY